MARLLLLLMLLLAPIADADVAVLTAGHDGVIVAELPTTNFSANTTITTGTFFTGGIYQPRRSLLSFSLSTIPVRSTVISAVLSVECASRFDTVPDYRVKRVTQRAWLENQVTWEKYQTSLDWTTDGGDFTNTDQGGPYSAPTSVGQVLTHSDAAIVAQVQTGVNTTLTRWASFIMIGENELASAGRFGVHTDEAAASEDRPSLTITYFAPTSGFVVSELAPRPWEFPCSPFVPEPARFMPARFLGLPDPWGVLCLA